MNNSIGDRVGSWTQVQIEQKLAVLLEDILRDWEQDLTAPITGKTRLVSDLGFASIDLIQLMVSLEKTFGKKGLPFDQVMMKDGAYISEMTVAELVNFLYANLMVESL